MSTLPQHLPGSVYCPLTDQWISHAHTANNLLAEHAAEAQLHVDLLHLLKRADALGLVVTVELQPLTPLAMRHYKTVIDIRAKVVR